MATKPKKTAGLKTGPAAGALRRRAKVLSFIFGPPLLFILHPTVIVAMGGMLPTLVAFIIDNRKERYAARTVGYLNFSGVFIVCLGMWTGDHTWQAALELLYEPFNWLIMFGTAALGWVLYFMLPPISGAYLKISNDLKLKTLLSEQEKLVKEWGQGVARNAPAQPKETPSGQPQDAAEEPPEITPELLTEAPAPKEDDVPSMADIGQRAAP